MNANIRWENFSFFAEGIGNDMKLQSFRIAVENCLQGGHSKWTMETLGHLGTVTIECPGLVDKNPVPFQKALNSGLLKSVAQKMGDSIAGTFHDVAFVTEGMYRFAFAITGYQRDGAHGFEIISNPRELPPEEKFGRHVTLTIALN